MCKPIVARKLRPVAFGEIYWSLLNAIIINMVWTYKFKGTHTPIHVRVHA